MHLQDEAAQPWSTGPEDPLALGRSPVFLCRCGLRQALSAALHLK